VGENQRPLGVNASRQIVGDGTEDVVLQVSHTIPVIDHLVVGDQHHCPDAGILQSHSVGQGPEVVADVQMAGGTVPCQDAVVVRMDGDIGFDLRAADQAGTQGGVHAIGERSRRLLNVAIQRGGGSCHGGKSNDADPAVGAGSDRGQCPHPEPRSTEEARCRRYPGW